VEENYRLYTYMYIINNSYSPIMICVSYLLHTWSISSLLYLLRNTRKLSHCTVITITSKSRSRISIEFGTLL